jgi:hypothetical protein
MSSLQQHIALITKLIDQLRGTGIADGGLSFQMRLLFCRMISAAIIGQ